VDEIDATVLESKVSEEEKIFLLICKRAKSRPSFKEVVEALQLLQHRMSDI
jgi:hypothetical protein